MAKEKRFIKVHEEGKFMDIHQIYVDKKTGVNYLFHYNGNAAGLCVLVDRDGKPLVTYGSYEKDSSEELY